MALHRWIGVYLEPDIHKQLHSSQYDACTVSDAWVHQDYPAFVVSVLHCAYITSFSETGLTSRCSGDNQCQEVGGSHNEGKGREAEGR